jgi:hypothetical protein
VQADCHINQGFSFWETNANDALLILGSVTTKQILAPATNDEGPAAAALLAGQPELGCCCCCCCCCRQRCVQQPFLGLHQSKSAFAAAASLLLLHAGQLELGEVLLQAIYQSQPALTTLSQSQLLHLLVLADRYGVNKVLVAAVAALQAVPQADLQWETVLGVYALPPGCTDASQPLLPAMQLQLQQQLGDLELAMSDSQKQQRLLALPHKVLLLLLQDEDTKVASENTGVLGAHGAACCLLHVG